MNFAVLLDAHLSESKHKDTNVKEPVWRLRTSASICGQAVPEVAHEPTERLHPFRERDDDVDDGATRVHTLTLHLHGWAERPEEKELREVLRPVAFEHQLIGAAPGSLCAGQPCNPETTALLSQQI